MDWKFREIVSLFLVIAWVSPLNCQITVTGRSQPFVLNFTRAQYGGANQNWSVTQGPDGIIYFGNTYGLLEYNGAEWILNTDPDIRMVRSTFVDFDGRIYTGSFEEFGYWQRNPFGQLTYTSLSLSIENKESLANTTIWRIFRCGEDLFFYSFDRIFIRRASGEIRTTETDNILLPMFRYADRPYLSIPGEGLFRIGEDLALTRVEGPGMLKEIRVQNIFSLSKDTSIAFTEQSGLFLLTGTTWLPVGSPDNQFLKEALINRVIRLGDDQFAIGTIKNGVIITDHNGKILSRLDRRNGLQNNNVSDLMKDRDNGLWIALQQGIDYTEINSPFRFVEDRTGQLGSVRCAMEFNGNLYLGTNHGLFYTDWSRLILDREAEFRAVPGLQGHVLSLNVMDGKLYCGYNQGTYLVEKDKTRRLSGLGGSRIVVNPLLPRVAYQGTYSGIGLYRKDRAGNWNYEGILFEGVETVYAEVDQEGNLWTSSAFRGLYRHRLNETGDSILQSDYFGKKDGFVSDNYINVFKLGNRIVFANGGKFFTYDYLERSVVPYDWLNTQLGPFRNAHIIYYEGNSHYWFLNGSALARFRFETDSLEFLSEVTYDYLHSSAVEYVENIVHTGGGLFVIGLVDGFAILNNRQISKDQELQPLYPVRINRFLSISDEGEVEPVKVMPGSFPKIPVRNRNLYVNFSVPGSIRNLITYRYRLNSQEHWTELGHSNEIRYNNLKHGTYRLEIVATEDTSDRTSSVTFPFSILPAWYFHWIALVTYLILVLSALLLTRIIIRRRIRQHQMVLQDNLKRESEKEMARIKEDYLQRELRNKNKELLNYTILLEKKNDLLRRMKSILAREAEKHEKPTSLQVKLMKTIDDNISNRDDWQVFKVHFDAANSDFLERLKGLHPNLTPGDLRFCGFLRMNLTSKEISSLLNISLRSIEVKRYRLRKKLNLKHNQNLVSYLMDV